MNNFEIIRNLIKSIESLDFKAKDVEWAGAYLQNIDGKDLILVNSVLWNNLKKIYRKFRTRIWKLFGYSW